MIFLTLAIVLVILVTIKYKLRKRRINKYFDNVFQPSDQKPIVGYAHKFFGATTERNMSANDLYTLYIFVFYKLEFFAIKIEIMKILIQFCEKNGCPQQFWFGPICMVLVGTAPDMQAVLTSPNCLQKSYVYDFFNNKNGLFTAPG